MIMLFGPVVHGRNPIPGKVRSASYSFALEYAVTGFFRGQNTKSLLVRSKFDHGDFGLVNSDTIMLDSSNKT